MLNALDLRFERLDHRFEGLIRLGRLHHLLLENMTHIAIGRELAQELLAGGQKRANLLQGGLSGLPQGQFILVAIGILGDLAGVGRVVLVGDLEGPFDLVRALDRDGEAALVELVAQRLGVDASGFNADHRMLGWGLVLGEPGQEGLEAVEVIRETLGAQAGLIGPSKERGNEVLQGCVDTDEAAG